MRGRLPEGGRRWPGLSYLLGVRLLLDLTLVIMWFTPEKIQGAL